MNHTMDEFAPVADSLEVANEALKKIICNKSDGIGKLERFEKGLEKIKGDLIHFKTVLQEHLDNSSTLQNSLQEKMIKDRKQVEFLKIKIDGLKQDIDRQKKDNDKLEKKFKDNIEHLKTLKLSNETYANTSTAVSLE